ncbi:hypothetical protein CVT25_013682 [Psilocybe cyanescens]|uniref:HMG box domain-containing protein n=1 Tax=Psilocybe cyanescens TaxID=93625 RepID=A0A409XBH6_PSICY|nr:hypothetical protein CVT25_013682 [Psilocybe cyanescens]
MGPSTNPPSPDGPPTSPTSTSHSSSNTGSTEKIKRPRNSFFLYMHYRRKNSPVRDKNGEPNKVSREVISIYSKDWKNEPEDIRAYFEALAEQEKRLHMIKYPGWKYKPKRRESGGAKQPRSRRAEAAKGPQAMKDGSSTKRPVPYSRKKRSNREETLSNDVHPTMSRDPEYNLEGFVHEQWDGAAMREFQSCENANASQEQSTMLRFDVPEESVDWQLLDSYPLQTWDSNSSSGTTITTNDAPVYSLPTMVAPALEPMDAFTGYSNSYTEFLEGSSSVQPQIAVSEGIYPEYSHKLLCLRTPFGAEEDYTQLGSSDIAYEDPNQFCSPPVNVDEASTAQAQQWDSFYGQPFTSFDQSEIWAY